eukprot:scaffold1322_cov372-Pavlova_lutheri.AAC.16
MRYPKAMPKANADATAVHRVSTAVSTTSKVATPRNPLVDAVPSMATRRGSVATRGACRHHGHGMDNQAVGDPGDVHGLWGGGGGTQPYTTNEPLESTLGVCAGVWCAQAPSTSQHQVHAPKCAEFRFHVRGCENERVARDGTAEHRTRRTIEHTPPVGADEGGACCM